jgi:hypothetical protein
MTFRPGSLTVFVYGLAKNEREILGVVDHG